MTEEPPHDVLAAEEFGVPAPDPALHDEPPHDVLAAEEFPVPAPDLRGRRGGGARWGPALALALLALTLARRRRG